MIYFTEQASPWLAGTVIGEVRSHDIFHGGSIVLWLAGTDIGVVGTTYFTKPELLWLLARLWAMSEPVIHFTEPAIPWLTRTVMGEVWAHNILHGASIKVIGSNGYGRALGPYHIPQSQHYSSWLDRLRERSSP